MKQYLKKTLIIGVAVLMLCASLAGCGQTQNDLPSADGTVSANSADAVAVLTDISTTQYFTDQAVAQEDIETIVQAGINAPSAMNGQPWHFSVITDAEVLQQISDGMGGGMSFGGTPQEGADGEMTPPEGMTLPEGMEGEMPEGMDIPEGEMPESMDFPSGEMPAAPSGGTGSSNKAGITDAPLVIVISCKSGSELDAGLACQNMSATAQLLGYGTKILTSPTMALNGTNQDTFSELLGIPEGYSAAAILLIGHEDTSVDTSVDGYTGATSRNPAEDMVTYILSK